MSQEKLKKKKNDNTIRCKLEMFIENFTLHTHSRQESILVSKYRKEKQKKAEMGCKRNNLLHRKFITIKKT
jgi:hypothetical protein